MDKETVDKLNKNIEALNKAITALTESMGSSDSKRSYERERRSDEGLTDEEKDIRKKIRENNNKRHFQKELEEEEKKLRKEAFDNSKMGKVFNGVAAGAKVFFEDVKNIINSIVGVANFVNDKWGKIDQSSANYAKAIGGSAASIVELRKNTIDFVNNMGIGVKYNTSAAELLELQAQYSKDLARNVQLGTEELENFAAMKQLVGKEQAIKFTANFERFGIDVNAASAEVAQMFNQATKSGISFDKYSKNFLDNIDMAQRYTFKKGLDGLQAMAKQSSAIRWNMQQTATFAEKVGTVEGSIKTGAQMSVLGGAFAKFANPMDMLYESLNDVESLNGRLTKLFSQFATYNDNTKQVEVSAFNRMRIKQATQAMGLDFGQVMDSVFAQGRRKEAEKQFGSRSKAFTEEEKEYLLNTSMIDRQTGKAYVTLRDAKGNSVRKNVSELTSKDKEDIKRMMTTETEDIKTIAIATQGMNEKMEGVGKSISDKIGGFIENTGIGDFFKTSISDSANLITTSGAILGGVRIIAGILTTLLATNTVGAIKRGFMNRMSGGSFGGGTSPIGTPTNMGGGSGGTVMATPAMRIKPSRGLRGLTAKAMGVSKYAKASRYLSKLGMVKGGLIGLAGGIANYGGQALNEYGANNDSAAARHGGSAVSMLGKTAEYAMIGATIGSFVPVIGNVAGAVIGGTAGLIHGAYNWANNERQYQKMIEDNKKKALIRDELEKHYGVHIGSIELYTLEQLQSMLNNVSNNQVRPQFAKGGLITGNSHIEGGVPIEAEGGEFVVNKEATAKHYEAIKAINNDNTNSQTAIVPLKPMGEQLKVKENNNNQVNLGNGRIDFTPINLNMEGAIKLDLGGYTKDIDARELINNPEFIRQMTNSLTKRMNEIEFKNFNRTAYWRKV